MFTIERLGNACFCVFMQKYSNIYHMQALILMLLARQENKTLTNVCSS